MTRSPHRKNELTDWSTVITKYLEMRCPLKGFIADMANVYSFLAMNFFTVVHQHGGWREGLTTLKTLVHTTFFFCLIAFSHIRRNLCHLKQFVKQSNNYIGTPTTAVYFSTWSIFEVLASGYEHKGIRWFFSDQKKKKSKQKTFQTKPIKKHKACLIFTEDSVFSG